MTTKADIAAAINTELQRNKPLLTSEQIEAATQIILADTLVIDALTIGGLYLDHFKTTGGIGDLLNRNAAKLAEHLIEAPSADDVRQHLTEQWRKSNGEPMPDIRLRLHREATSMTADERIASGAKPNSAVVKNQVPPVYPEVYADPSEAQADAWDLQIQKRWGHQPGTILASKRRQLIDAMKTAPPVTESDSLRALNARDPATLDPVARLAQHYETATLPRRK